MILPSFIQEPALALIGERCYNSLITNLNLNDTQCVKLVFSKALGIGIVLGGSLIKLPQVLKIIANGSARGLSFESYVLETIAYAVGLAYNFRQGNPFSTYGENLFLTIQDIIILLLILNYRGQKDHLVVAILSIVGMSYALGSPSLINESFLAILQTCTIPLSLASKIPQIVKNYENGSTGQLSAFAVFGYTLGSIARIFTTVTEVNDSIILIGFSLAAIFNAVLALQMLIYWNAVDEMKKKE
ncbi:7638_t:CDS:1 [Ambispora leptoticha]|uniref:Mannose-P-dolichol utilization defect 1 protein homolog n=1 Tax=Ambispora leptoticha TaxID=144679 RepID=A0A9N9FPN8_9GLOM|nr:7638_t:CDS:1 [Ambispora leptoticha]